MRLALAALVALTVTAAPAEDDAFAGAGAWLNAPRPLTLAELRGQVVLLDFWTSCCINCLQVFPDLKRLEATFADQPLVVVGVHSGKFDEEKDPERIRDAARRHALNHPIAVDSDYAIWNRFGVHAWPTLVLLDVDGSVSLVLAGEGHHDDLERAIRTLLDRAREAGTLAAKPLRFAAPAPVGGALAFPGKVVADGERVFVADTGHHQIVELARDGGERRRFGSGAADLRDGGLAEAAFREPQGLALAAGGAALYVADRGNHALRAIDLASGAVRTLAGDGRQGRDRRYAGDAAKALLASPWDVVVDDQAVFVAMAGAHQLWRYDAASASIAAWAGTGAERCVDGALAAAAFAQPSGLALDGRGLWVADSETSSIRRVDLDTGTVTTVAGSGELFGFGLVDGVGAVARFQHPLGIAVADLDGRRTVFVADSFDHVVRALDPATGAVTRFAGTGRTDPGAAGALDAIGFSEPGGIAAAGDELWIADTNHHRLVAIDLRARLARVVAAPPIP